VAFENIRFSNFFQRDNIIPLNNDDINKLKLREAGEADEIKQINDTELIKRINELEQKIKSEKLINMELESKVL
jgi:hypothetical protein